MDPPSPCVGKTVRPTSPNRDVASVFNVAGSVHDVNGMLTPPRSYTRFVFATPFESVVDNACHPTVVPSSAMRFLAVFALIAVAEMATFFWVESRIGLGWALGLALATALIGSLLVKRAGLTVLSRIQEKVSGGQLPGRELSDGATVLVSGAFLISPGFLTDLLGFLLLVPAVRGLVYQIVSKRFLGRITVFNVGTGTLRSDGPGTAVDFEDSDVIDVEELE